MLPSRCHTLVHGGQQVIDTLNENLFVDGISKPGVH